MLPQILAYLAVLCFERRYHKQNTVALLKSIVLPLPQFWAGCATVPRADHISFSERL